MKTVEKTTAAGSGDAQVNYPVRFLQGEDLAETIGAIAKLDDATAQELRDFFASSSELQKASETVNGIVCAAWEQNAKQSGKEDVRKAIKEHGVDSEQVEAAIKDHQQRAAKYVIGAPRGSTDGITKTKARTVGEKLRDQMPEEEFRKLAEDYGIELD